MFLVTVGIRPGFKVWLGKTYIYGDKIFVFFMFKTFFPTVNSMKSNSVRYRFATHAY